MTNGLISRSLGTAMQVPRMIGRLSIIVFGAAFISLGRFDPGDEETLDIEGASEKRIDDDDVLTILTWNLGYAGLGKESSFFYGAFGKGSLFPPSREIVRKNLVGEIETLKGSGADIVLLQEVTTRSVMNFDARMMESIRRDLADYDAAFSPSVLLDRPFNMIHGNSMLSRYRSTGATRHALPLETSGVSSKLRHRYNFIIERFPIEGTDRMWTIIDLHFSAFDRNGETRKKQLDRVKKVILDEYQRGNRVVVGGDWNMRLVDTDFGEVGGDERPAYIEDMPGELRDELIEAGWTFAVDPSTPSIRTNERPYDGKNYMTVIDGFLCSPNVELVEVRGMDLGFEFSDHNPVRIRVRGKSG